MNENMCLDTSEAAEIDEYWLNSFTNMIKTSTPSSASVFKSNEPDCLLHQFVPTHYEVHSIKLSKKINNHIITVLNPYQSVWVAAMYKQKANKVQPVGSFKSDEKASENNSNWQQWVMNTKEAADFY